jgi:hypothetical protein
MPLDAAGVGLPQPDSSLQLELAKSEIVFIDPTISNLDNFIANLRPEAEAVVLDYSRAALTQMAAVLKHRANIKTIHVVAHGCAGEIRFAAGAFTIDTLDRYTNELTYIVSALRPDGDLRLWSCNIAQGEKGGRFIEAFARRTGANVAGATGLVGSVALGGEWRVESKKYLQPPLTPVGIKAYPALMAITQAKLTKITTDSGAIGDFVTNDNTLTFSGTDLDGGISTLGVWISGGAYVSPTLIGSVTLAAGQTNWSYNFNGTALPDGTYTRWDLHDCLDQRDKS